MIAVEIKVTSTDSARAAGAQVGHDLGPIEVAVNDAGWDDFLPFVKTDEDFLTRSATSTSRASSG